MPFQLGVYSFGNMQRRADGSLGPTGESIRNLLECIQLAEQVGLDFFGVGEHHTLEMPISSPSAVINAPAAVTRRIGLGSTVTVLSTDDPVRVYQQHATAAALAPGRVEITAGRGSSTESFPLFGYRTGDYDELYAEKLELLLACNASERVTWAGKFRGLPLNDALVVPRAEPALKIWLGTGGNPDSSIRAGVLGLPVAYGILGGNGPQWARVAELYRAAGRQSGHRVENLEVAVAGHGFIADDSVTARDTFYEYEGRLMASFAARRGMAPPDRAYFDRNYGPGGMVMVGGPEEVAERLVVFQRQLGHCRHILQMDLGQIPQRMVLRSIELLGTRVAPLVRSELRSAV